MDERYWERLQEAFTRMTELPSHDQEALLREMYSTDPVLAEDLEELLKEDAAGRDLPEANLAGLLAQAVQAEAQESPPHFQIGPYRLVRLLGEGGMGVVYLAQRTDIGGFVAMKLLRDAWLSPIRRQRFAIEQQMLAQLNHPSIARIYDAGTTQDGTPWFAMEYAEGSMIGEYLRARSLTERELIQLFRVICDTVRFAHNRAIIHRDLKPSNIIVMEDGRVKLLDFGIAKQLDVIGTGAATTTEGWRLFTPAYAAPELKLGQEVGVYTDIYSLGVILYELLTGTLPGSDTELVQGDPERPSRRFVSPFHAAAVGRTACADLDAICLKALQREPDGRYGSMDALISDLDAFLTDEPLTSRKSSFWYTATKYARRKRMPLLSLAAALLIAVAGTVLFTVRLALARDAATRSRDRAVAESARAERIERFTETLFTGGSGFGAPPPNIQVKQMLDRGRIEALQMVNDPELQVSMFRVLGTAYATLGRYTDAEPLLQRAQRASCGLSRSLECAEIESVLGGVVSTHGSLDDEKNLIEDALRIKQALLSPNDPALAKSMLNLANTLVLTGDYKRAGELSRQALTIESAVGHPTPQLARALAAVGQYNFAYNDPRISVYENRAAQMNAELFGAGSYEYATSELTLGNIALNLGRYAEAEQYLRAALAAVNAWAGLDQEVTIPYRIRLGFLLSLEGKLGEAKPLLLRALSFHSEYGGATPREAASAMFSLGFIEFQQGHLNDAESYFGKVVAMSQQHMEVTEVDLETSELGLADIYGKRHDDQRSEAAARSVLANTRLGATYIGVVAHSLIGSALLGEGRFQEADAELEKAHTWFAHDPAIRPYTVQTYQDLSRTKELLGDRPGAARILQELRVHPR